MPVKFDASNFKRKMGNLSQRVSTVNEVVMKESARDLIESIRIELAAVDTTLQVGFDPELFINNLRLTLAKDQDGTWSIDPWLAGGTEADLEQIAGRGGPFEIGEHTSKSLWHMGTGRTDAFFRLILGNVSARGDLAALRQGVWREKTPQWFLINYGSTVGQQPAEYFIEKAASTVREVVIKRNIKNYLQQGWR